MRILKTKIFEVFFKNYYKNTSHILRIPSVLFDYLFSRAYSMQYLLLCMVYVPLV